MKSNKVLKILAFVLVIILMVLVRVFLGAYFEYSKGSKFLKKKDPESAQVHFTRSIRWYTPLNPYVRKSIDRVMDIAESYESQGQKESALNLYENLRSSIYSTRSFYIPFKKIISQTDEKIAKLRSSEDKSRSQRTRKEIIRDLSSDSSPSVFYSIMAIFGFFGWIMTTLFFIFTVMKEPFIKRKALICGIIFFLFYIFWLFGLARA